MAGVDLTIPGDAAYDRGSCGGSDRRHIGNVSAVYQFPRIADGVTGMLVNDWQLSAIFRAQTGGHFSALTGVDSALTAQTNQRPNLVSDVDLYVKEGYRWLNPAAFQSPAPGTYGDLENNSLVGPGKFNVDVGIVRAVRIGGTTQIQFRAEAFNVLNRVHLNLPVSSLNSPSFGTITSADDPRILQLAVKVTF